MNYRKRTEPVPHGIILECAELIEEAFDRNGDEAEVAVRCVLLILEKHGYIAGFQPTPPHTGKD